MARSLDWAQKDGMVAVIYQCPIIGKKVQAWFEDAPADDFDLASI
jgi:hypothetical protein